MQKLALAVAHSYMALKKDPPGGSWHRFYRPLLIASITRY